MLALLPVLLEKPDSVGTSEEGKDLLKRFCKCVQGMNPFKRMIALTDRSDLLSVAAAL